MTVSQSYDQAEILILFREALGGSIGRASIGRGLIKPMLQWRVFGRSAQKAACALAPHSITKRRQLLLAAEWPDETSCREDCKAELRALKEYDSAVAGRCSWEYCAGFFDAEGHIKQQHGGASIVLTFDQKHAMVLRCLSSFFAEAMGVTATVGKQRSSYFGLSIFGLPLCKRILLHMLQAGLLCKEGQASLTVYLTSKNAERVSKQLAQLTGNQAYGRRHDEAGRQRARHIQSLQSSIRNMRRRGNLRDVEVKEAELEVLRHEHSHLKARLENLQLLEQMQRIWRMHDQSISPRWKAAETRREKDALIILHRSSAAVDPKQTSTSSQLCINGSCKLYISAGPGAGRALNSSGEFLMQ